jgi:dolichol-phosphate mannosyltransferase
MEGVFSANGSLNAERKVAVVIPAYRAERHIEEVLGGIPAFVSLIVVVDDCSPDRTAALVETMARRDHRIRLIRHVANQGVGGAVLSGYQWAHQLGAEIIVKMDADGQMDPAQLGPLIHPLLRGEADYTKGNRFLHARQLHSMPLGRRIGNLGLSLLTKLASGYWNIFDPTNGYTAIHAALVPKLDVQAIGRRYFFESSLLLELGLLRAVVRDVYIPARYGDESSNLSILKTLLEFPGRLLRGLLRRMWVQYFVRDFGMFSLLLLSGLGLSLFGFTFGTAHWIQSVSAGVAAPTGTVMLSVLPLILGIQFLLQSVLLDIQSIPLRPLHRDLEILSDVETTGPRIADDDKTLAGAGEPHTAGTQQRAA